MTIKMRPEIDIEKIARLARLELTGDEAESFKKELEAVIGLAEKLSELPDLPETKKGKSALREDIPGNCLSREELLSNAPEASENAFAVPRAVRAD